MNPLIAAAKNAQTRAYAPYSNYKVGAAVLDEGGRLWSGCNVENISYGVTMCAERVAIGKMVSEGGKLICEVAVATKDGGTPCGICLQTLLEFCYDPSAVKVTTIDANGAESVYTLRDLIPHGFRSTLVSEPKPDVE